MRPDRRRGARLAVAAAAIAILLAPRPAPAHPLGNFSISHYSAIRVADGAVSVRYVVDLAEIPTFQEIQETGIQAEPGHPRLAAYLAEKAEALRAGLHLEQDGRPLSLRTESRDVIFPPGAGGLPTMKLGFAYRADLERPRATGAGSALYFRDDNFPGRAGWKEIVAAGEAGVALAQSSVPERDRSGALSDYPTDLLHSPPQVTEARVVFVASAPVPPPAPAAESPRRSASAATRPSIPLVEPDDSRALPASAAARSASAPTPTAGVSAADAPALHANRQATARSAFTELIAAKELRLGVVLLAVVVAAALGALHALEPGHGKTVVGAYLVGSRGTASHAVLLGLIVTASHTAGVYLLGAVTLFASRYVVPERVYPWLGVTSGLLIAGVGFFLLRQRYRGEAGRSHSHGHHHHGHSHPHGHHHRGHEHPHADGPHHHTHDHSHEHEHGGDAAPDCAREARPVPLRQLVALGVSGGIVPCPAALVVLLSALALHRVGFGLLLIAAFSAGLAAVLIAVGLLIVHAQRLVARFDEGGGLVTRWLPVTSAAMITLLGVGMVIQALATAGVLPVGRS